MISYYNQLHVLLRRVTAYLSHLSNIKRGQIGEKWIKKKTKIITILTNKVPTNVSLITVLQIS